MILLKSTASRAWSSTPRTSKARSVPGGARAESSTPRRRRRFRRSLHPKEQLPPLLQGFGAVPPLITDIDLSMDDRFLYVSCWGTGEMRQYDVTDPMKPRLAGSVRIGGIARRTPHPNGKAYAGGPQMVEISRDGKRVYWTNSLYSTLGRPVLSGGVPGADGHGRRRPGWRPEARQGLLGRASRMDIGAHQIRLDGGDCSTRFVLLSLGLNVSGADWTPAWLWLAVVASGLYHGLNPGMGWPLAVSAGLMERSPRALLAALGFWRSGISSRCS